MEANLAWYVLRVQPQKEFAAERVLIDAGVIAWLPTEVRWRRACRRAKSRSKFEAPLIWRYVFVGFQLGQEAWATIRRFRIVQGVLSDADDNPLRVPARAMARLFRISASPVSVKTRVHRTFRPGDHAELCDGPFSGRPVVIEDLTDRGARVLAEIFGSEHKIIVPLGWLDVA
jgi:transcription antitermination factor NusG